ncbi:MAG: hypothetical protein M1820_001039 [Bogoriella megaspora]|nr:MAG: hypothetical protein M1820_001039 [Bogoriella megaspora]
MAKSKLMEGVLAINKPPALTSADVLRDLQRQFDPSSIFAPLVSAQQDGFRNADIRQRKKLLRKQSKVKLGHGGTLDPLATGVLVVGIGSGTKQLGGFLDCTKSYECVVTFGAATDSYDSTGKVVGRAAYDHITKQKVEEALSQFRGKIMQKPPIFSALKVKGKKMYEYAREGKELPIEIQERPVEVVDLELADWMESGTHEYRLPSEDAAGETKAVVSKILRTEGANVNEETEKTEAAAETGAKRPHTEDPLDGLVKESPAKRVRTSSKNSFMSGALPVEESSNIGEEKEKQTEPTLSEGPEKSQVKDIAQNSEPAAPPAARIRMTVTSGFYVRSLCHDLGIAVGSLGMLSELKRTRQGQFELGKNVLEYEAIQESEDVWGPKVQNLLEQWANGQKKSKKAREASEEKARRRRNSSSVD